MKLHYDEAQMEPAGVPAVIAYRGGEKFAGLVPIINELPDDADLSALTLEAVMKRFAIPPPQRLRILLITYTDTRSLPESLLNGRSELSVQSRSGVSFNESRALGTCAVYTSLLATESPMHFWDKKALRKVPGSEFE